MGSCPMFSSQGTKLGPAHKGRALSFQPPRVYSRRTRETIMVYIAIWVLLNAAVFLQIMHVNREAKP